MIELTVNDYGLIYSALRSAQQTTVPRDVLHDEIERALVALERVRLSSLQSKPDPAAIVGDM